MSDLDGWLAYGVTSCGTCSVACSVACTLCNLHRAWAANAISLRGATDPWSGLELSTEPAKGRTEPSSVLPLPGQGLAMDKMMGDEPPIII